MAKQFKIYFSRSEETIKEIIDEEIGEETISIRRLEIEMLKLNFQAAARIQKEIPSAIECKDVVDQLENITDDDEFVELTKKDIDYFKGAWSKTSSRPYSWVEYGEGLLNQIMSPFEPDKMVEWDQKNNKFIIVEKEVSTDIE